MYITYIQAELSLKLYFIVCIQHTMKYSPKDLFIYHQHSKDSSLNKLLSLLEEDNLLESHYQIRPTKTKGLN